MASRADGQPAITTSTRSVDRPGLTALADSVARGVDHTLTEQPGPRGSILGICIAEPVNFMATVLAARQLGVDAFLIPAGTPAERVLELCAFEHASLVICDEEKPAAAGVLRECVPGLVVVDTHGPGQQDESGSSSQLHDEPTLHFFSSGSEGQPRGLVRTHSSLDEEAGVIGSHLGLTADSVVLCTVPLSHSYAFTGGLCVPVMVGGTSVVVHPRLPGSLVRALETYRPEVVYAVPAQYAAWAALKHQPPEHRPRLWLSSGAPLADVVRRRFEDAWGATIAEQYGLTECGAVSVDLDGSESAGRPYPGATVTIDLPDDEGVGDVVIATPWGPCCYVGAAADTHAAPVPLVAAGFRSGDRGRLDGDGALHLVGRRANQINVRGRKVDPGEVERAIWAVDGVRDVAVVGIPRAGGDDWVAAFVVCDDGVSDAELVSATARLEMYKRPQRVTRLAALPRTGGGKTDPAALRALLATPPG